MQCFWTENYPALKKTSPKVPIMCKRWKGECLLKAEDEYRLWQRRRCWKPPLHIFSHVFTCFQLFFRYRMTVSRLCYVKWKEGEAEGKKRKHSAPNSGCIEFKFGPFFFYLSRLSFLSLSLHRSLSPSLPPSPRPVRCVWEWQLVLIKLCCFRSRLSLWVAVG